MNCGSKFVPFFQNVPLIPKEGGHRLLMRRFSSWLVPSFVFSNVIVFQFSDKLLIKRKGSENASLSKQTQKNKWRHELRFRVWSVFLPLLLFRIAKLFVPV